MRFAGSVFILLVTLFGGCSTISMDQSPRTIQMLPAPPPLQPTLTKTEHEEADLQKDLGPTPTDARKWWTTYQIGRLWMKENPERACEQFYNLSKEPRFPLANLARIRALDVCPTDLDGLLKPEELSDFATEPWLTKFAIQTGLSRALRLKDNKAEMMLSYAMAQQSGVLQSEKIRLIKRALELAAGDDDQIVQQRKLMHGYLVAIAPRFNEAPDDKLFLAVAGDFKQAREFDKARDYYQRILKSKAFDDVEKYRALEGIRSTYKLQKNTDVFIEKTKELNKFAFERFEKKSTQNAWAERYHDSTLLLARTLWTEGRTDEARKVIAQLQKNIKGIYPADESLWVLSRIEEEAGHFENTVALLNQIDGSHIGKRDLKTKILWYKAWNLRRIGKFDDAIENFNLDLKADDSAFAQSRTHYWLGRTYADKKETSKAEEEYKNLVLTDPLSYYGLLASRELHQELSPLRNDDPSNKTQYRDNKAFARSQDSTYFEWLIALGEEGLGQDFLDAIWTATRKNNDLTQDRQRDLLRMYPRVGGYKSLFAHINELQADQRNSILREFPSLLFPQPFKDIAIEAGKKFDVETELIYSIMRQESSFDPHARSGADAFGLLQLIPEVAKEASKNAEVDYHDPEQLYEPAINIPLGAAFLRILHDKYHGQFIPTVASYNASDKAIQNWLRTRARADTLEFIEDIPFEETRGYVRLVMRNYIFYKRFNSGGKSIPFPEACLDVKQPANP